MCKHKWAEEKWKYPYAHSIGEKSLEETLCPDSSSGTSWGVSVLFTFRSTKWNQLSLLPQLFPHLCTKAQSLKLIQIQLAICVLVQQNQLWYTVLLSVSNRLLSHNNSKKLSRLITQNKGQFQSLQVLISIA